ncbi:uncharacterized protein LOC132450357 [Gadus macrocephalus]|uniref:uncharacterized protein LOC132450357 n=1 Tax=Gadus macrocephalus TaxID=80720 RepID=UPI0028CB1A55|nr:uncharacterized protein LOC132450357 [Gadus macrocephalus]
MRNKQRARELWRREGRGNLNGDDLLRQEEEATPDLDSSSPSPDPPPPHLVSTSSQKNERLRQVVIRWLETNEEANDPDQGQTAPDHGQTAPDQGQTAPDPGQTAPDHGQTAPDQGQTAPDPGQTAPDQGQTAPDQEPQHQGEGSGPFVAWLPPTADGPPGKDLAQVVGNLKVRVKGVRKLSVETATMDPGQTAQEPNQLPNVPDSPPTKALAQVMGNLRFRVKGLKKKRVQPATTSRLDEEKPLGRPSGRSPFPGQTAPDRGQTAPDQGQTAPDQGQTANEPADRAPRKDLTQVLGNMRVRVRALRKQRIETATIALTDQEEEKPLGRLSRQNPFKRIKMAWADPKAAPRTPLNIRIWSSRLRRRGKPQLRLRGRASGPGSTSG